MYARWLNVDNNAVGEIGQVTIELMMMRKGGTRWRSLFVGEELAFDPAH